MYRNVTAALFFALALVVYIVSRRYAIKSGYAYPAQFSALAVTVFAGLMFIVIVLLRKAGLY